MMLTAFLAFALQAAAPVPTPPPADTPSAQAGRAWGDCVKGRLDARMRTDATPDALVTEALDHCARQEAAIRAAIAAERGDEVARLNVERIRSGGRQLFLLYIERERRQNASRQPS